jgi:hypothetical protein
MAVIEGPGHEIYVDEPEEGISIGGVSLPTRLPPGGCVAHAEGYAAFFMRASHPQLSVITPGAAGTIGTCKGPGELISARIVFRSISLLEFTDREYTRRSIFPEVLRSAGCQFRVPHRVLNILVAEIELDGV